MYKYKINAINKAIKAITKTWRNLHWKKFLTPIGVKRLPSNPQNNNFNPIFNPFQHSIRNFTKII